MKKKLLSLLVTALLLAALLPATVQTAFAQDYGRILSYQVDVTPNVNDGSLAIRLIFRWKALEDLPAANSQQGGVKIGIPNGSIRDMTALTDNIDDIQYDNSYAYVDFVHGYDAGEEFSFSFSWVQEYMYRLNGGAVVYDYTPGWFDGILVDEMTLTWHDPAGPATALPRTATTFSPPATWTTATSSPWPSPTATGPPSSPTTAAPTTCLRTIIPIIIMTIPPATLFLSSSVSSSCSSCCSSLSA